MNLTKAIRATLAAKIAAKAVEIHAPSFNRQVTELNSRFAAAHEATLLAMLPDVKKARWDVMIQDGLMFGTDCLNGYVRKPKRDEKGVLSYSSDDMGRLCGTKKVSEQALNQLQAEMGRSGKWAQAEKSLGADRRYHTEGLVTAFCPKYPSVMPKFLGCNDISLYRLEHEHVSQLTPIEKARLTALAPLVAAADTLSKLWHDLLTQALEYRGEVHDLPLTCKTRKQLEAIFPEAAAMLPPEVVKRNEILPAELAKNVRRRLLEGVPA